MHNHFLFFIFFIPLVSNMASMEDIKFLLSQQTETLNIKREEDIKRITDIVEGTVKTQIEAALDPITKRQDESESRATEQYTELANAIAALQQAGAHAGHAGALAGAYPALAPTRVSHLPPAPPIMPNSFIETVQQQHQNPPSRSVPDIYDMIEKAERTVGFKPLKKSDVDEVCRVHNTNDTQYAMKILIMEYLHFEMKNKVMNISNIIRVFPSSKSNWNILYAEFDTRPCANTVYWYTKFLNKGRRVMGYIPHPFFEQFDLLSDIAHKYRQPPNIHKTKIRFGQPDMYLEIKPEDGHIWYIVNAPNLPPLNMQYSSPDLSVSPSLAPGRPQPGAPKRAASSSPPSKLPKFSRPNSPLTNQSQSSEENPIEDGSVVDVATKESDDEETAEHSVESNQTAPASSLETQNFL